MGIPHDSGFRPDALGGVREVIKVGVFARAADALMTTLRSLMSLIRFQLPTFSRDVKT